MRPICRIPHCQGDATDELGFCSGCAREYADRRTRAAEISAALCAQRPELFEQLPITEAQQLAAHLVGHASEGERGFYARFWAGIDFIRETRELSARVSARRIPPQRRRARGVPHGISA